MRLIQVSTEKYIHWQHVLLIARCAVKSKLFSNFSPLPPPGPQTPHCPISSLSAIANSVPTCYRIQWVLPSRRESSHTHFLLFPLSENPPEASSIFSLRVVERKSIQRLGPPTREAKRKKVVLLSIPKKIPRSPRKHPYIEIELVPYLG
jgi:hypothetical protein